jgi:hypothetical protein
MLNLLLKFLKTNNMELFDVISTVLDLSNKGNPNRHSSRNNNLTIAFEIRGLIQRRNQQSLDDRTLTQ